MIETFKRWLSELADRRAKARIQTRLDRMAEGHFGDCMRERRKRHNRRINQNVGQRYAYAQPRSGAGFVLFRPSCLHHDASPGHIIKSIFFQETQYLRAFRTRVQPEVENAEPQALPGDCQGTVRRVRPASHRRGRAAFSVHDAGRVRAVLQWHQQHPLLQRLHRCPTYPRNSRATESLFVLFVM